MTREEAIRIFRKEIECLSHAKCEDCILEKVCDPAKTTPLDSEYIEAYGMAIQALSQEPCDEAEQIDYHDDFETALKKINDYEMTRDERAAISILNAYKVGYESGMEDLEQQPCDDAISRKDAEQMFRNIRSHLKPQDYKSAEEFNTRDLMLLNAEQMIYALPSVTQKPKTGHWIEHPEIETSAPEYLMFYECSECGDRQCFCKSDIHKKRFCSNCGCRMVEPQESETWNGYHGQITAPKGTFKKIWELAESEE